MKLDVGMLTHDLKTIPEYARKVEALGFDCLWSAETQHDPVPAAGGGRHGRPAASSSAPRSPWRSPAARWSWPTSPGTSPRPRAGGFILGLGSQVKGHNERRFSVKWEAPAPRMREVVLALRAIWDCWQNGTKLNFKGQFYRFDLMTPFFNPGPIEHPAGPGLRRGREPAHVPRGRRGVRRPARAPVQQPQVPARARAAGGQRGPRQVGPRAASDFTYATASFVVVGDTEAEQAHGAPGGEAADRLLRLHPHLRAGAGRPRLAGPRPAPAPQVGGGRLEGHGRSHHRRDGGHVRGHRHHDDIGRKLRSATPACSTAPRSTSPASSRPSTIRACRRLVKEFNG